jgi:N-acetylglucosamine malate deacetylase 1
MRQALKESNGREQPGQRDKCGRERARMPRTEGRSRNGDDERGERKQEEEELDGALAQVAGPEQREPGEGHERSGGQGQQRRQRLPDVAPSCAKHECEERGAEDDVERHEQVGLLRADRDGDSERRRSEESDRDDRWVASERHCACANDENTDDEGGGMARRADEQLEIRPRYQSRCEGRLADRGHGHSGQELGARARKEHRRRPQPADYRRQLSQVAMGHEGQDYGGRDRKGRVIGAWKRVLVLAPHTDDGEFGAGGTMTRLVEEGAEVRYVAFSIATRSLPEGFPPDTLAQEVKEATAELGISPENLTVHDFDVRTFPQHRQDILELLVALWEDWRPDAVFQPSLHDIHQDHQVIAAEGLRAFKRTTILGYEIPWNNFDFAYQAYFALQETHVEKKVAALSKYASQQHRRYSDPEYIRNVARTHGINVNREFAEVFEVYRLVT